MTASSLTLPVFSRRARAPLCCALALGACAAVAEDTSSDDCIANAEPVEIATEERSCGTPGEPVQVFDPATLDGSNLDWVSLDSLSEDQLDLRALNCNGGYLDPLGNLDSSIDSASQPIHASANRSEIIGDLVRMSGGAVAVQGNRVMKAEEVEFQQVERWASLHGNVELREPGMLLRGATATAELDSGAGQLTAASYLFHEEHIRGGADLLKRREDGLFELSDAVYSYCPPNNRSWELIGEDVELDFEEGVGVARDATVELNGIPVLYTPYLEFPLDDRRKTGFLWPTIGSDSEGGLDVATPYYFNIAPNLDSTLTPRWINDRGLLTELELRYLSRQIGSWELGGAYIHGDDQYEEDFPDQNGNRWLAAVQQDGLFAQRWRTNIDFTKTEDDDYLNDFNTTTLQLRESAHLAQNAEMNYLGDSVLADVRIEEWQTIARDVINTPYEKLPQVSIYSSALTEPYKPKLIFLTDFTEFDHDEKITGQRFYNEVGLTYPMKEIWGSLQPTLSYRQINYELDEPRLILGEEDDSPDVGAPLFSLDGELIFERSMKIGGNNAIQTLEPRLFYLWADFEEQAGNPDFDTAELTFNYAQLWRSTRFSGRDRLADANQVSAGVTTRIIDLESGVERLKASIGQIYYFDDREVFDTFPDDRDFKASSEIAAELDIKPNDYLELRSSLIWNHDQNELENTSISTSWENPETRRIVNLGYNFRRYRGLSPFQTDTNQVDLSSYFPLNQHWSVMFRLLYDFEDNDSLNDMVGIEYNDCCWRIRLVHARRIDQTNRSNQDDLIERDHATYLQFQLKGLGGTADNVSSLMEELIRGFEDSDK